MSTQTMAAEPSLADARRLLSPPLLGLAALLGATAAVAGCLLPSATAYSFGVLLLVAVLTAAVWRHSPRALAIAVALGLVVAVFGVPALTLPRSSGLSGDWSTRALPANRLQGNVIGDRALVADSGNAAIDLTTGTTIKLGSVPPGGTPRIADGRLLIASQHQIDSAGLDAKSRWTWHQKNAGRLDLMAAAGGVTVVRDCEKADTSKCALAGLDAKGRQQWLVDEPGSQANAGTTAAPGTLPALGISRSVSDPKAVYLTDPSTGRNELHAADQIVALPDGRVTLSQESGGSCVTTAFTTLSQRSTDVRPGACPAPTPVAAAPLPAAHRISLRLNPFRGEDDRYEVKVGGRHTATLVSPEEVTALLADNRGLVVREGAQVVRYVYDQ